MKKERERSIVDAFLMWRNDPTDIVLDTDRERPDALVQIGGRPLGLEITTITEVIPRQSLAPQKWNVEAVRLVHSAHEHFQARNSAAVIVRFELRPEWQPPTRSDFSILADEFVLSSKR